MSNSITKSFLLLKSPLFLLGLILVISFWVRTYKIDNPIADWHAWRQADTAAVARSFYQEGFNPFIPKYHDMSDVNGNGLFNLQRYRMVEFPIYNTLVYLGYLLNGGVDTKYARLVSVILSLGSIIFIFLISRKVWGNFTGLIAASIFAFLPFNIFYSRVVLPEPAMIFFSLGMIYFIWRWIEEQKNWQYLIGLFFSICALLVKPYSIFFIPPLIYLLFINSKNFKVFIKRLLIWLIPSFIPFLAWRIWIANFPEGIPASSWLLNGTGIRFRPAFWRWMIVDRFNREILSVTGIILFFLGGILKPKNQNEVSMFIWLLSSLSFLIVFATGNVQHDYYQTLIIPAVAIFTARGLVSLLSGIPNFLSRIWTIPLAIFLSGLMFYFSWYEIRGLYQINNNMVITAGEAADNILPKDAVVVAPWGGDTTLLYHINRNGFPYVPLPVEEMINNFGVTHYLSLNYDNQTNEVMRKYKIVEQNDNFVIVDLREKNPNYL